MWVDMKLTRKFKSLFLTYFLLLSVTISALADSKNNMDKESPFVVRVKDHLLTVKVRDISLKKVLMEIANQTLIKIVFYGPVEEFVSMDFYDIPLDKGLKRLTRDINYAFIYGTKKTKMMEPEIREIIISPKTRESTIKYVEPTIITPKQGAPEERKEAILVSLFKALEDKDPVVREEAVDLLSESKDGRAFKHLTEVLLNDEDEDVRARAAKALGDFGDQRAIDPLIKALQDKDVWVRENVVNALGQIGEERVISPLMEVLRDEDGDVRGAATDAIKEIKEQLWISATD